MRGVCRGRVPPRRAPGAAVLQARGGGPETKNVLFYTLNSLLTPAPRAVAFAGARVGARSCSEHSSQGPAGTRRLAARTRRKVCKNYVLFTPVFENVDVARARDMFRASLSLLRFCEVVLHSTRGAARAKSDTARRGTTQTQIINNFK